MIKLFVSDIDGCLARPYHPLDLKAFQVLAGCVEQGGLPGHDAVFPAFSICTGRPFPYAEAVAQSLGVQAPLIFESGGGMYNPKTGKIHWNPTFTAHLEQQVELVKAWMIESCVPGSAMNYDYAKRTQPGLIGPDEEEIIRTIPLVEAFVAEHTPELEVFTTPISIDVLPPGIVKEEGLAWLSEVTGIALDTMAYIGDARGDIEALKRVGFGFAPANAIEPTKAAAKQVTSAWAVGVVEAYEACLKMNQPLPTPS